MCTKPRYSLKDMLQWTRADDGSLSGQCRSAKSLTRSDCSPSEELGDKAHAASLRSPSQSVRNPTTEFQLRIVGVTP